MEANPPESARLALPKVALKHAAFAPVALVLLSLATVGTAWCSFQAAAWGGVSQRTVNLSGASSRRAVTDQPQSYQMALLDVLLFSQHVNARASFNKTLARFHADRFAAGTARYRNR